MIQKIKQMPVSVIIAAVFLLGVFVMVGMASPGGTLTILFLLAIVLAVARVAHYFVEGY